MKNLIPLMRREWLQHRFAWALLVLVPLALAVLPLIFGSLEVDGMAASGGPGDLALMVGTLSIVISSAVIFLLLWVTSLFIALGTPRRDHADRSVEFWLSLPTGHSESLTAPLLVHLLLVPAAALLAGLACGVLVSFITVSRLASIGEWFSLPWGSIALGLMSLVARVIAGLPMAVLWLLPLLLAAMLANAFFKRWGLPVLAVGVALSSAVMNGVFGQPLLYSTLTALLRNAGLSLMGAGGSGVGITADNPPGEALSSMPGWAAHDFGASVQALASPLFLGSLAVSALLFYGLVIWRQRGAGAQG
jgi:ABC-2 type transport system permease protein